MESRRAVISHNVKTRLARSASWLERLPPEQWSVYKAVMAHARLRGLQFAVGGGFATMTYTGQWRDTKDMDFFILERDKDEMIRILAESGLEDYYDQQAYERHWIYRSHKDETIVDVIWAMANRRAAVDEGWLHGPLVEAGGERFRLVPAEETLWSKLYVLQRDRCDWPDGLSLIYAMGTDLDWCRLLERVGEDAPLLSGLVSVFGWLCPDHARELPGWLWNELGARHIEIDALLDRDTDRVSLLDSRPWLMPDQEE
ncbi:MAG: hypothetical protein ACR2IV_00090 [Bryobacteraceae bacterium]